MPAISKKVSFGIVVALLLGWGAMSLLLIQSSQELLQAQLLYDGTVVAQPRGVQLNLQVDKKVYRSSESILISLRNDSRQAIWLPVHSDGCIDTWWQVERLLDGDNWQSVQRVRAECVTVEYGLQEFAQHTVMSAEWNGLIQANVIGEVFEPIAAGTYRISVPFLHGDEISEEDWNGSESKAAISPTFTIQEPEVST